jgi:phospholipid-binding lipoprotein MlaA
MSTAHFQRSISHGAIKLIKYRLFVFLFIGFIASGCAHKAKTAPSLAAERTPPASAKPLLVSAETDQSDLAQADDDEFKDDDLEFSDEIFETEAAVVSDPLYHWNRAMFEFNDKLYYFALRPVAKGYKAVVPWELRYCIRNFFQNILFPVRFVNCLLQGKLQAAGAEFGRFFINTTVGFLGLADIAKRYPALNPPEEDLGQTLAVWGIGNGPYIYWPILGPATLRDTIGLVGDIFLNPLFYNLGQPLEASIGASGLRYLNETSYRLGDYEALKESALEPYEAFRDFYIRYRENKIRE